MFLINSLQNITYMSTFLMETFIDLPVKISKYQKVDDKFYYVGKKDGV